MATRYMTKFILQVGRQNYTSNNILNRSEKLSCRLFGMSAPARCTEPSSAIEKKTKQLKKTQFKLSQPLMKGFIAIPLICAVDFDINKCKFEWFRRLSAKQKNDLVEKDSTAFRRIHFSEHSYWLKVGDNFTYSPCDDDVAHILKCICEPNINDLPQKLNNGVKYWICSEGPVEIGPKEFPFEKRHLQTTKQFNVTDNRLRFITYNILADLYADSDYSKTVLFAHCPAQSLAIGYRRQLLLKEIQGYNGDIICLQEVDKKEFNRTYEPYFRLVCNYNGVFHTKGSRVAEGVATFFRCDRFELVDSHRTVLNKLINPRKRVLNQEQEQEGEVLEVDANTTLESANKIEEKLKSQNIDKPAKKEEYPHPILSNLESDEASELLSRFDSLRLAITKNAQLHKRFVERHTILQTNLLKVKDHINTFLIVANTHLYFAPDADHVRLLQGCVCVKYMEYIKDYYAKLLRTKNYYQQEAGTLKLSILFCGDMNSSPDCGLFRLLHEGSVGEDLKDWQSNLDEQVTDFSFSTNLRFSTAYKDIAYTNYTPEFNGCLDYIYYELNGFDLERVVPLPDHEDVIATGGIPSDVFPSDHVALIADLKCK